MSAKLIAVERDTVRIELNIKLSRSMLESEEAILNALNEAGCIATGEALKRFDTDGSVILIGGTKWTSKGEEPKYYQTPYGEVGSAAPRLPNERGGQDLLSVGA